MAKKGKVISINQNSKQAKDTNYSEVFRRFVDGVYHLFSPEIEKPEILEICIQAWNYAILSQDMPDEEFEFIKSRAVLPPSVLSLLDDLIKEKNQNYKRYNQCIVDFQVEHFENQELLRLETISKEGYLIDMLEEEMDDDTDLQYEPGFVNRHAIIVSPRKPFLNWLKKLFPEDDEEMPPTKIYLADDGVDPNEWLEKNFDRIFLSELEENYTDSKQFPKNRTFKMFLDWFEVNFSIEVFDIEPFPLRKN